MILIRLILAVLMVFAPNAALAQAPEPEEDDDFEILPLEAAPRELQAGRQVTAGGEGCAGDSEVVFHLYYPQSQANMSVTAPTNPDGTFGRLVTIPPNAPEGRVWLTATCATAEGEERIMQTVLLVSAAPFAITMANILFGLGSALLVMGIGTVTLQRRHDRRRGKTPLAGRKRRVRVKKHKRRRKPGAGS